MIWVIVIIIVVVIVYYYWKNNRRIVESEGYKEFEADEESALEYLKSHGYTSYVRKKGTNLYAVTTGKEEYTFDKNWTSHSI